MKKIRRDRGSKYTDEFKRELGTESRVAGISVPVVAKQLGVGTNRIHADRSDGRFQPDDTENPAFTPVEISDVDLADTLALLGPDQAVFRVEISLEIGPCLFHHIMCSGRTGCEP